MQQIKAAVCYEFGKPLAIETVRLADPGDGELCVEIKACAICHSDLMYADGHWGGTLPAVYGHEASGVVERHLIGHDPFHIEQLWRNVYGSGYNMRPDVSLLGVLSGIEMACWDIVGKACDKPVYELLGGQVHEGLRSYTYIYPAAGDA